MKLIVGLGNPRKAYANNRHNVGFLSVNHLAKEMGITWERRRRVAILGRGEAGGQRVVLAKPRAFMNLSGEAVGFLIHRWKIDVRDLIVIYDDMDLPLGKIRIRERGGAGGHKGIESIILRLGTEDFPRIRVGIGRPEEASADAVEYVLGDFTPEEREELEGSLSRVAEAVLCILEEGIATAMNRYN